MGAANTRHSYKNITYKYKIDASQEDHDEDIICSKFCQTLYNRRLVGKCEKCNCENCKPGLCNCNICNKEDWRNDNFFYHGKTHHFRDVFYDEKLMRRKVVYKWNAVGYGVCTVCKDHDCINNIIYSFRGEFNSDGSFNHGILTYSSAIYIGKFINGIEVDDDCKIVWNDGYEFHGSIPMSEEDCENVSIVKCYGKLRFISESSTTINYKSRSSSKDTGYNLNFLFHMFKRRSNDLIKDIENSYKLKFHSYLKNIVPKDIIALLLDYNDNNFEIGLKFCNYDVTIIRSGG